MTFGIKISVIIPVWNPGEGIRRCLHSLENQTLKELEFLFVDDHGTDGSMDVIREAKEEDPRIRILVNPKNMGQGYGRNRGIEEAKGEYLSFVDPDDYPAPDFYELLYKKAKGSGADIVKGSLAYEKEDGKLFPHHSLNDQIRSGIRSGKPYYYLYTYEHHGSLFRREMILDSGARYGLARRAQDTTFLLQACHAAQSLALEDRAVYYFVERHDSAMHVLDPGSLDERLFSFREQVDYLLDQLPEDPYAPGYTVGTFQSALRFFSCYEVTEKTIPFIENYTEGMRAQILRLPFRDEMKNRCFPVRALLDHHTLLPSAPGYMPWEKAAAEDWLEIASLWTDYYLAHPETFKNWLRGFVPICKKAKTSSGLKSVLGRLPMTVRMKVRLAVNLS